MIRFRQRKLVLSGRARSEKARPLSISIYPAIEQLLRKRERQFNMSRSQLIGVLLEVDSREGLIQKELVRRLAFTDWTKQPEGQK